jgi:hypothetical protein
MPRRANLPREPTCPSKATHPAEPTCPTEPIGPAPSAMATTHRTRHSRDANTGSIRHTRDVTQECHPPETPTLHADSAKSRPSSTGSLVQLHQPAGPAPPGTRPIVITLALISPTIYAVPLFASLSLSCTSAHKLHI